jgi:hypothetical protein
MQPHWVSLGGFGLFGIAVLEVALSATWNDFYFRFGIPIFVWEIPIPKAAKSLPRVTDVEQALLVHNKLFAPITFRRASSDTFFFREHFSSSFFRVSYSPVMHGQLTFDASTAVVRVLGFANWSVLAFLAFFATLAAVFGSTGYFFLIALLGILSSIYLVQFIRFRTVAMVAAECWSTQAGVRPLGVR